MKYIFLPIFCAICFCQINPIMPVKYPGGNIIAPRSLASQIKTPLNHPVKAGYSVQESKLDLPPSYKLGDKIMDFGLLNYDGKIVHLSDFKKEKGVIIIFMRISCEYCEAYETRVMDLDKKYKSLGFRVWAISPFGDNPKDHPLDDIPHMKIKAKKMGYTFPYSTDDNLKITNAFHDQYTPTAYVLENRSGSFFLRYIGEIDSDWTNKKPKKVKYVERIVDSLLNFSKPLRK